MASERPSSVRRRQVSRSESEFCVSPLAAGGVSDALEKFADRRAALVGIYVAAAEYQFMRKLKPRKEAGIF